MMNKVAITLISILAFLMLFNLIAACDDDDDDDQSRPSADDDTSDDDDDDDFVPPDDDDDTTDDDTSDDDTTDDDTSDDDTTDDDTTDDDTTDDDTTDDDTVDDDTTDDDTTDDDTTDDDTTDDDTVDDDTTDDDTVDDDTTDDDTTDDDTTDDDTTDDDTSDDDTTDDDTADDDTGDDDTTINDDVKVAFQYVGMDGDVHLLDDVLVTTDAKRTVILHEKFTGELPSDWNYLVNVAGYTWQYSNAYYSTSGNDCAYINYNSSVAQDEWMISPVLGTADNGPYTLTFWNAGSIDYSGNATLKAHYSCDGGDTWNELYSFPDADEYYGYVWYGNTFTFDCDEDDDTAGDSAMDDDIDPYPDFVIGADGDGLMVWPGNVDGNLETGEKLMVDEYTDPASTPLIADFNDDGYPEVIVGDGDFGQIYRFLNNGDRTFTSDIIATFGNTAKSFAAGHFNADAYLDLAILLFSTDESTVEVMLGNGDGTFGSPISNALTTYGYNLVAGDIDEDGYDDLFIYGSLLYSNYGFSRINSNGDGTFGTQTFYATSYRVTDMAIDDFNGDGHLDCAVGVTSGNLYIMHGDGANALTQAGMYFPVIDKVPDPVEYVDMDGDGRKDLLIGHVPAGLLAVDDSGLFPFWQPTTILDQYSDQIEAFKAADFNGDGFGDIIFNEDEELFYSDYCTLMAFGDGQGSMSYPMAVQPYPDQIYQPSYYHGDLDNDGREDLLFSSLDVNYLKAFFNRGNGKFNVIQVYRPEGSKKAKGVKYRASDTVLGDYDGDGDLDAFVLRDNDKTDNLRPFWREGSRYVPGEAITQNAETGSLLSVLLNADAYPDLAFVSGNDIGVIFANGDRTFTSATMLAGGAVLNTQIAAGDLNGDGHLDLLATYSEAGTLVVFINNGDGSFAAATTIATGATDLYGVAVGDFDEDGNLDAVVTGLDDSAFYFLHGNGNGTFAAASQVTSDYGLNEAAVGEFTGDSHLDLAVFYVDGGAAAVFPGQGNGTFGAATPYVASSGVGYGLRAFDMNRDGVDDLVFTSVDGYGEQSVYIVLADGTGGLEAAQIYETQMIGAYGTVAHVH